MSIQSIIVIYSSLYSAYLIKVDLFRFYCSHYFWYVSEIAGYKNLDMCKNTLKAICTKINGVREKRQMFHFCKRKYLFYKVFFFCFFLRSLCCPNGFQFLCFVSSWIPLSGFTNVYGIANKWLHLYIFSLIFSCCDIYNQAN
jgi:hypothetical protein